MTMTATITPTRPTERRPTPTGPIVSGVLRSEWTKLRTVRSTYWTLLITVVGIIGISILLCAIFATQYAGMSAKEQEAFEPISFSLSGVFIAQLAIGVLGVLVITSEYASGMIRSSISAVPQRLTLLAAKATVFAAVTLVVGMASCLAAFFIGQAILSSEGIGASIGDPGAIRAVIGGGLYVPVLGLMALGLGAIVRRSAGGIAAVFGLLLVLPSLVLLLPSGMADAIAKFLPSSAGQAIIGSAQQTDSLSPWVGFGVFCLWAAAALVAGAVTLQRRDA